MSGATPSPKVKIVPHGPTGETVLIVEDHTRTREALRVLFERKNYHIVEAKTYRDAVSILLAPDGPSLALLDWMLPDGTGIDICRTVRGKNIGRYVYMIIMTSLSGEEDIAKALTAGADDFIHKPCGPVELMARLRNGVRTVTLERNLEKRIAELEAALASVNHLSQMLEQ